jgi:HNH endonuclease
MRSKIFNTDQVRAIQEGRMTQFMQVVNGNYIVELRTIPVSPNDDYMAGSDGQIYSRTKFKGFGRKEYVDWYPLKGHIQKRGYQTVSLCHNSKKVTKSVHRLVCMAFHGMPNPITLQVRHLDSDPSNNKPSNLCWGTQYENQMDKKIAGHIPEGDSHFKSILSEQERIYVKWAVDKGIASKKHIARALGVTQIVIQRACKKGFTKTDKP